MNLLNTLLLTIELTLKNVHALSILKTDKERQEVECLA